MREIETTIVIERPVERVFDYVVRPENWPTWSSTVIAVTVPEAGRLQADARFNVVAKLLGRQFDSEEVVTDFEPDKVLAYTTASGPMPGTWTWRFEAGPEGTRLVQTAVADEDRAGRFFKIAWPIGERIFRRQMAAELATLKDVLEAEP
jgi:uncharacterized membrane protein